MQRTQDEKWNLIVFWCFKSWLHTFFVSDARDCHKFASPDIFPETSLSLRETKGDKSSLTWSNFLSQNFLSQQNLFGMSHRRPYGMRKPKNEGLKGQSYFLNEDPCIFFGFLQLDNFCDRYLRRFAFWVICKEESPLEEGIDLNWKHNCVISVWNMVYCADLGRNYATIESHSKYVLFRLKQFFDAS